MKRYFRQHLVLALALAALVPTARNHFVVGARYRAGHGQHQRMAETTLSFIGSCVVSEAIT